MDSYKMISNFFRSLKNKSGEMSSSTSNSKRLARPNKAGRASFARDTINNYIPHILKSNDRARHAIENAELIFYSLSSAPLKSPPAPVSAEAPSPVSASLNPEQSEASNPDHTSPKASNLTKKLISAESPAQPEPHTPKIRVIQSDTYDAVEAIIKSKNPKAKVAALNMASALRPGGGVLSGAMAQEESLCMRSTLFNTLNDSFYRIPEKAAIYSPNVLVFRDSENQDLPKADWYYTNVISCAALNGPDLVRDERKGVVYEWQEDYEKMLMKVRLIIQIAKEKEITHLVLGALGCGAYRNPPLEVAKVFRKVLLGDRKRAGVTGIEEIVFAIFDDGENLRVFKETFEDVATQ